MEPEAQVCYFIDTIIPLHSYSLLDDGLFATFSLCSCVWPVLGNWGVQGAMPQIAARSLFTKEKVGRSMAATTTTGPPASSAWPGGGCQLILHSPSPLIQTGLITHNVCSKVNEKY